MVALLCALCLPASAVWLKQVYAWSDTRSVSAKTLNVPPDTCFPVYLAPFDDAFRPENGLAEVSAGEPFSVLADYGDWHLIEYPVTDHSSRVGWARFLDPDEPEWDDFPADATCLRLIRNENLTDDPWKSHRIVTRLHEGDLVTGLAEISRGAAYADRDWLYVQTELDGQTAWLFIDANAVEEVPMWHQEGDTAIVHEGVTRIGSSARVFRSAEVDDSLSHVPPLRKDEVSIHSLDLYPWYGYQEEESDPEENPVPIRAVVLPDSLRMIGDSAFLSGSLETFRFPETLEYLDSFAFYGSSIGRVIFPAGYTLPVYDCYDRCEIGAFEVEEGNPLYSSRDGVLFSADGTVLLRYPNGKTDEHYDVPAGVTEIADGAFYDDEMLIPLKTLSLPMGLQKIGEYAFSGCGRLHSLTVPLTVTELNETAFAYCVSLERLSLPPQLTVPQRDLSWADYADLTWYNGDNGTTLPEPLPEAYWN